MNVVSFRDERCATTSYSLHPDVQKFIDEQVRAGQYATPADVINDAILRPRARETFGDDDFDDDDWSEIEQGLAEADRCEGRP